ncbi:MAG: O-antigen ligase family protein [Pseudomonadota bacterium]
MASLESAVCFLPPRARGELALVASTFFALAIAPLGLVLFDLRDHDGQRIVQLALLAIAAGVVAVHSTQRRDSAVDPSRRALAAAATLGVLAALSILNAEIARAAALETGVLLALAVFAFGIGLAAQRPGIERMLLIAVAASVLFAFAVVVRYTAALSAETPLLREHLLPAYSNYRFFNHVQTVTIPLLVGAMLAGPLRLRRWAAAALVAEFALLFFTGGRATMLALGAAAAAIAAAFRWKAAPWLARIGATALAGAALYLLLFDWVPQWRGLGRDFFSGDTIARSELGVGGPREYLWALAWQYIRESPWLGIGPMHYAHRINAEAAHPHNVYLQLAAEWGVPFAVLVVGLAAVGWLRLLRVARASADESGRAIGISLVAAGVAIAVDGMFSGNFVMPMSQLWIAFAIGLAIAYVRSAAPVMPAAGAGAAPLSRWAVPALCVLSQIAIWQGVWPEILDVNAHVDRVRAEIAHNVVDNPRIWSHGWVR